MKMFENHGISTGLAGLNQNFLVQLNNQLNQVISFKNTAEMEKEKALKRLVLRLFPKFALIDVVPQGLEPRQTDPETVVLPLHNGTIKECCPTRIRT